MFCYITQNWRAMLLASLSIVIALISKNTRMKNRLEDFLRVYRNTYLRRVLGFDADMASLNITRDAFHQDG